MLTIYPLSLVLAASFVAASVSTLHLDRANSMFNRDQIVIKKGLGLALLNKLKLPPTPPLSFHNQLPLAMDRKKVLSNFHPMVRLRSDTMQNDYPYHAVSEDLGPKSFDDADNYKMFEEEEVDGIIDDSINLGDDGLDNVVLSDFEPVISQ